MAQHIKSACVLQIAESARQKERKMVTKDTPEKRPCGRPCGRPQAGAVLVDGRWQPTEQSLQIAAARLLRARECRRDRRQEMRKLLRQWHPDLFDFARKQDPTQTTLTPEVRAELPAS